MRETVTPWRGDGNEMYTFEHPKGTARRTPEDVIRTLTSQRDKWVKGQPAAFYLLTFTALEPDSDEVQQVYDAHPLPEIPSLYHLHGLVCGCKTEKCGLTIDYRQGTAFLTSITYPSRTARLRYLPTSRVSVMPHGDVNQSSDALDAIAEVKSDQAARLMTVIYQNSGPDYLPEDSFPPDPYKVAALLTDHDLTDQVVVVAATLLEAHRERTGSLGLTRFEDVEAILAAARASVASSTSAS